MTKKELVKIIQEAVRREVKKEVKKIFIKEETSSQLKDITPVISKPKNTKEFFQSTMILDTVIIQYVISLN